jgi:hypothetical protein
VVLLLASGQDSSRCDRYMHFWSAGRKPITVNGKRAALRNNNPKRSDQQPPQQFLQHDSAARSFFSCLFDKRGIISGFLIPIKRLSTESNSTFRAPAEPNYRHDF